MTSLAVAAPSTAAVEAACSVAAEGGNAVDAAVAAIATATVTEFSVTGPMGGGFINVWEPGSEPVVIDGNTEMPGRGLPPERFGNGIHRFDFDYFGPITLYGGPGTVGTPGLFKALDHAHRRWARLPWREAMTPAIVAARDGYPLGPSPALWLGLSGDHLFGWDPECVAFVRQHDGELPTEGQIMRSADLANSFETIARDGADTLYTGEIAHAIADDMEKRGGLLTLEDLAAYRTVERPALRARIGSYDVAANPPPSIGGPVLTALLRTLHARTGGKHATPTDIIEAMRLVLGYRWAVIDETDDLITAGHELIRLLDEQGPDGLALSNSPDTIHVSVVDADGLACSITTSCGYCSGYITPGTGLLFNNALGEVELNRRGFHVLPPGQRISSNMAPTTARRDDGSTLAIGSPGADRITTALMQVIGLLAFDNATPQEAILHPRIHLAMETDGLTLRVEPDPEAEKAAAATGLPVNRSDDLSMYFGGVGMAGATIDRVLHAVADPRRAGATGIWP